MLYYDGYYSVEIVVWFTYRLELSIAKKACLIFEKWTTDFYKFVAPIFNWVLLLTYYL